MIEIKALYLFQGNPQISDQKPTFEIVLQNKHIDMRRSKGYTNKLEKLTCDDGAVTLTIKLKKAAEKK